MSIMRYSQFLLTGIATAVGGLILLSGSSAQSQAQKIAQTKPPGLQCHPAADPDPFFPDPFVDRLVDADFPAKLLPIDDKVKDSILNSGLPCQERVSPKGVEKERLENLQRGFDFYSWRTFIALNSPADGKTRIDHAQAD